MKCVSAHLGTWASKASGGIQHQAEARDEQSAIVCNEADGFKICAKQQYQKYKEKVAENDDDAYACRWEQVSASTPCIESTGANDG